MDQSSQPVKKFEEILSNKREELKEYRPSKECGKNCKSISSENKTVVIEVGWEPVLAKLFPTCTHCNDDFFCF